MSKDDLTTMTGGGKPDELKNAIRTLRGNMPEFIEHAQLVAQIQRAKFLALLKEGFTPEQALLLCRDV